MHQVFDAMAMQAKRRPNAIAFRDDREALSRLDLAGRVYRLAAHLRSAPSTIGIDLPNGVDYVVADLATTLTGRRVVPLPSFFSDEQRQHIIIDADIGAVIGFGDRKTGSLPLIDPRTDLGPPITYEGGADRVIYTSGSSGKPKGVIVGDRQLSASIEGLMDAVQPTKADRHLSVLPFAQLLEQIAGIFLPILSGVESVITPCTTSALFGGPTSLIALAFDEAKPTTSLLVPALLNAWIADLKSRGRRAPKELRFVAIGGAPIAPHLIEEATALGIPAHEGYGLSECCAVVALNRPGENASGTVGRPLKGIDVSIDDGEIVVTGPTVMDHYLGVPPIDLGPVSKTAWRTGDLGHFSGGNLVIEGRKDALLITPTGRNISPEWIEKRLLSLPMIACAALTLKAGRLIIVLATRSPTDPSALVSMIEVALADIPAYARPDGVVLVASQSSPFMRPSGMPDRCVAQTLAATTQVTPLFSTQQGKAS